jgi:prepilin-type N-terminal cleavage/methylation domain-containing protein
MQLRGSRGFSLLEIMIAVMALAAMAALSLGGLAGQRERATSEGMARVVASELESARVRALKNGYPVAVCFPSENGSTPETQSFYLMDGEVRPAVVHSRQLKGNFPQSRIVNAYWGAASLPSTDADKKRAQLMESWLGAKAGKDYALIFLPDGTVTSNDLPLTDGNFRLLVASGATYTAGNLTGAVFSPTPDLFELTGAFAGQTILVSTSGRIQTIPGVLEPTAVTVLPAQPPTLGDIAELNLPATEASTVPVLKSLEVAPEPFLDPKATVQKERNLSLKVSATDEDGDQLFCTWTAVAQGSSPGTGFFSLPDRHPMLWDREAGAWISDCTWAPPPQCDVGDTYRLTCIVTDPDGNEIPIEQEILDPVTVIPPGKVVGYNNWAPGPSMYVVNSDGTDFRHIATGGAGGSVSPDGSRVAWRNIEDSNNLWVGNLDGTGQKRLTNLATHNILWSGDGRYVLSSTSNHPLQAVSADGSQIIALQSTPSAPMAFTPDGEILIFRATRPDPSALRGVAWYQGVAEFDSSGSAPVLRDLTDVSGVSLHNFICWIPGESRQFLFTRQVSGAWETVRGELIDNGTSGPGRFQVNVLHVLPGNEFRHGIYDTTPVFSPDGSRVVLFRQNVGMFIADWADSGTASLNTTNERKFYSPAFGNHYIKAWVP